MGSRCCFFPHNLMSSTCSDRINPCFRWAKRHSQFVQVKSWDFVQLLFFCQFAISRNALFRMSRDSFCVGFFPLRQFFSRSSRNSWFEHFLYSSTKGVIRFAFTLCTSQMHMVKKWFSCSKIDQFHLSSSTWEPYAAFFQSFSRMPIRIILVFDEQIDIPSSVHFPIQVPTELPQLSHKSPASGWPHRFLSTGTNGSLMPDHYTGHLCHGRRTDVSGHSDFGILNSFGASSDFTWV